MKIHYMLFKCFLTWSKYILHSINFINYVQHNYIKSGGFYDSPHIQFCAFDLHMIRKCLQKTKYNKKMYFQILMERWMRDTDKCECPLFWWYQVFRILTLNSNQEQLIFVSIVFKETSRNMFSILLDQCPEVSWHFNFIISLGKVPMWFMVH